MACFLKIKRPAIIIALCTVAVPAITSTPASARTATFCGKLGDAGTFKVKPTSCLFFIDSDPLNSFSFNLIGVYRITWKSWGAPTASGRGRGTARTGHIRYRVTLSKREPCKRTLGSPEHVYTRAIIRNNVTSKRTMIRLPLPEFC